MFIEAVIIGLFIGGFRGGRLNNIIDMNIRGWYIILLAIILQLSPLFLGNIEFVVSTQKYLLFISTLLVLIVVLLNLDKKGFWILLVGGIFNIGVMMFNNLQMPVTMTSLQASGLTTMYESITDGSLINYVASDATSLIGKMFTKFIIIPKPYPFPKILTIGDVIMTIGLFVMVIGEMSRTSHYGKSKMAQYSYGSSAKKR